MKRCRVCFVFVTLPVGGAENILLSILKHLDRTRFDPIVCCLGEQGELGRQIEKSDVRFVSLDRFRKRGISWSLVRELSRFFKEEKVDLVHSNLYHANLYARLAAGRCAIPCVIAVHNTYSNAKWHRSFLNRRLNRFMQRCLVGSQEVRDDVVTHDRVPEEKILQLDNSIDLSLSESGLSREEARERLGLSVDDFVLVTVARLEVQKGHAYVLDALERIVGDCPGIHYLVVGSGREEGDLRRRVREKGLDGHLSFLGTRRDLGDIFRACDLYLMSSRWEGLSLAMLSAVVAGLPVIATRVGGVEETLGEGRGTIVEPESSRELEAAIRSTMNDLESAMQGAARAAAYVRTNYSDVSFVERLMRCYDEVLQSRR